MMRVGLWAKFPTTPRWHRITAEWLGGGVLFACGLSAETARHAFPEAPRGCARCSRCNR